MSGAVHVDLKDRVVVFAGSGGRFGKAVTAGLAASGATALAIDAGQPAAFAALREEHGRLDGLLIDASEGSIAADRVETLCRAFAEALPPDAGGRIVIIVSVAGIVPVRGERGRSMSAAAIVSLTRALAMDLAPLRIAVNAVAAGFVEPGGEADARMLSHVPVGRPGTADDIANAALFLLDPDNSYMSGHTLAVDGGWLAGYARDF